MKKFFLKNIIYIVLYVLAFICYVLVFVSPYFLPVATFLTGLPTLILGIKAKQKYNALKADKNEQPNVFDATKIDYDEDVYYFQTEEPKKIHGVASKFNALMPSVALIILGIGFMFYSLMFVIKLFL